MMLNFSLVPYFEFFNLYSNFVGVTRTGKGSLILSHHTVVPMKTVPVISIVGDASIGSKANSNIRTVF